MEQPKKPKFNPNLAYSETEVDKPKFNPNDDYQEVSVKKKVPTTSISKNTKLASEVPTGSSVGVQEKVNLKKGTLAWNHEKMLQNNPDYVAKYDKYTQAKTVTEENKQKALQELQSEKDNFEVTDYLKSGAKRVGTLAGSLLNEMAIKPVNQALTMFGKTTREDIDNNKGIIPLVEDTYKDKVPFEEQRKLAEQEFLNAKLSAKKSKNPIPKFTEEDKQKRAEEIFLKQKLDSYSATQVKDFMQDHKDDGIKTDLSRFESGKYATLQEKDKTLLEVQNVQRTEIGVLVDKLQEKKSRFEKLQKQGISIPENELNDFKIQSEKYQNIINESIDTHTEYAKNRKDIGSSEENLDVFKRDYHFFKNFLGQIDATLGDLSAGAMGAVNYGFEAKKNITGSQSTTDAYFQTLSKTVSNDLKSDSEEKRAGLMKSLNVDNINNLSDMTDYFAHTIVAQQLPNMGLLIATDGVVGVGTIGATSGGSKFQDMQGEVEHGEKQYSSSEMMLKPAGYAVTETASAMVDKMLLNSAGRVLASATAPERTMIAKSVAKRFLYGTADITKQVAKGSLTEGLDEAATQGFQNLIDDKPFMEGIKDPFVAGAILGGLIPGSANLVSKIAKPFSVDNKIQKASSDILKLQSQLDNPSLSLETKAIIQETLVKTKEKADVLLKNQVKNIQNLSKEQFSEIKNLEVAQANIKNKAQEIEFDDNLDDSFKKQILGNLKTEFAANNERRIDLLSQTNNVNTETIDNNKTKQNDSKTESTVTETEPQAEVQKPSEEEKVDNVSLTNEGNKLETPVNVDDKASEKLLADEVVAPSVSQAEGVSKVVEDDVKPIGELGNGSNIYFETEKYRVNDLQNGKVVLNIGDENDITPIANVEFDSAKEAVEVAKKLNEYRPNGLNKDYNIEGVIETLKNEVKDAEKENGNITSNGNVPVGDNANLQQQEVEAVQPTNAIGESKGNVKRIKSVKEGEFDISFDENGNISKVNSVKDGREIPKFVERINPKTKKVTLVKNANYSRIEADALGYDTNNKAKVDKQKQVAEAIDTFQVTNEYDAALHALGTGVKVSLESIKSETGNKDATWATNQSSKTELPSIEKLSETIWGNYPELDQTEIRNALIDIIGSHSSLDSVKNSIFDSSIANAKKLKEQENYALLGSLTDKERAMYEALQVEDDYLSELSDKEVEDYYNEKYDEYEQGRATTEAGTETVNQKPINSSESNEGTQEGKTTEKVKDTIFNQDNIKEDLDWLDGLKLDPNNINSTLPFLPRVWNALIDAIKVARMAGNTMSKAIEIAREELSKKFDTKDIDNAINAFAEKYNIILEKRKGDFERKAGKKSLLNRLANGENSKEITEAIESKKLNYEVRNQEKSNKEAIDFINEFGIDEAYKVVKNGLIKNTDMKVLIYNEIVQRMPSEIDNELESISDLEEYTKAQKGLYDRFAEISDEYSNFVTDLGQGISILNYIYNKNGDLKYELSRQIDRHKSQNNGEISQETLAKFKEADKKIKELNEKLKQKEEELSLANAQQGLQNIIEEQLRVVQSVNRKLSSKNAKIVANKVRELKINRPGIFKSSVGVDLVWDGAIETVAKAIEQTGNIAEAIEKGLNYIKKSDWFKALNDSDKKTAEIEFRNSYDDVINSEETKKHITISKDGKIKIPLQIIKGFIDEGVTDINEMSKKIQDEIKKEYPEVSVRNIRDAISGYGNKVNKSKTQLETDISKLKSLGKLTSQLEDLEKGISKAKDATRKRKLSSEEEYIKNQIKQLKDDLGIADKERTERSKNYTQKRIEEIKEKIKNKDYSKKEIIPIQEDNELRKLRSEKLEQQEIFEKDAYLDGLRNRTRIEKFRDNLLGIWNIPRVLMATGEMSWMLIQGGVQTISNPIRAYKATIDMIKAMSNTDYSNNWERELKSSEFYALANKSKLALTESDHRLEVREEQFLGDYANLIWDLPGLGLEYVSKNKEVITVKGKVKRLFNKNLSPSDFKTLNEQWRNANPMRVLERGNTMYMNQMRINRFMDGVKMLEAEGKNSVDHINDYQKLASVVNTLTGRANIGILQTNSKLLAATFFSFRNWVSKVNMLNPYYYASLNNFGTKPSVAQKIMVADMMKFITVTTTMMFLIKAAAGDDDEGNPNITIENDPRSSDFLKLKIGNLRLDPWGGLQSSATFFSRIWTEETKSTKTNKIVKPGEEFGARTRGQLLIDYASGKFNPSAGLVWEYMWTAPKVDEDGMVYRENKFGEKFDITEDIYNLKPMYWGAINEIKKEQPGLWGDFIIAAGALGINSQVYGNKEKK
jgi:hypothetical protein